MTSFHTSAMRNAARWCLLLIVVAATAISAGTGLAQTDKPAAARWAIVAGDAIKSTAIVDLLTVEASKLAGVELVERESIGKVLDELRLNSSGMIQPEQRVAFGKLTAADAIVQIDQVAGVAPPVVALKLIETRGGVQLFSQLVPFSTETDVTQLTSALRDARAKSRIASDKRVYVGFIGFRSEEPGDTLLPLAQALSALIEVDLQRAARVVLLEREQLGLLTKERELTGVELQLRASTIVVEGGMLRNGEATSVTLVLRRLASGDTRSLSLQVPSHELQQVRAAVLAKLASELNSPLDRRVLENPRDEAGLLARRCDALKVLSRHQEAAPLAEAALALDPTKENRRRRRDVYDSIAHHFNHIAGEFPQWQPERAWTLQRVAMEAALRIHRLDLADLNSRSDAEMREFGVREIFEAEITKFRGEPDDLQRLRAELDAIRLEKYELIVAARRRLGVPLEEIYVRRLERSAHFARSAEEFNATVRQLIADIDADRKRHASREKYMRREQFVAMLNAIDDAQSPRDANNYQDSRRRWSFKSVAPLLQSLAKHRDPLVQLAGNYGLAEHNDEPGAAAARQMLDALLTLPFDAPHSASAPIASHEGRLALRAVGRLHDDGAAAAFFESLLKNAENSGDIERLAHCPPVVHFTIGYGADAQKLGWSQRAVQLVDRAKLAGEVHLRAQRVREIAINQIKELDPTASILQPRLEGAWTGYDIERIDLAFPRHPSMQVRKLQIDATNAERPLALLWGAEGKMYVGRASVDGGKVQAVGDAIQLEPSAMEVQFAANSAEYYVTHGRPAVVTVVTAEGTQTFTKDHGAPAAMMVDTAFYDGKLYLGYLGAFASFDPREKRFQLIASAHAVKPTHRLHGGDLYQVTKIVPDLARRCLWLVVASGSFGVYGIWRYDPSTGDFTKTDTGTGYIFDLSWDGEFLLFEKSRQWYRLDARGQAMKELSGYAPFRDNIDTKLQTFRFVKLGDDIFGGNGQIYSPDGAVTWHPQHPRWDAHVAYDGGLIAADFNTELRDGRGATVYRIMPQQVRRP